MPGIAKMVSGFGGPDFNLEEQRRLICNLVHPDFAAKIPDALVAERFAVARTQPKDVLARMRTPNLGPRLGEVEAAGVRDVGPQRRDSARKAARGCFSMNAPMPAA